MGPVAGTEIYGYPVTSTPIAEKCGSFVTTEALTDFADAPMMASATDIPGLFILPAFDAISAISGIRFSFEYWICVPSRNNAADKSIDIQHFDDRFEE